MGSVSPDGARGPSGGRGRRHGPPTGRHGLRGQVQSSEDAPGRNREARNGRVIAGPITCHEGGPPGREHSLVTRVERRKLRPFLLGGLRAHSCLSVRPTRNSAVYWLKL